ncbi:hypothetical protein AB0L59_20890 [Streptomyces sp. NPDC052109]|uniref:hypothetical protein n=1 Tax=Streptomyces sp. NPDC052109 TaxID=3155527 RepID=UPI0034213668
MSATPPTPSWNLGREVVHGLVAQVREPEWATFAGDSMREAQGGYRRRWRPTGLATRVTGSPAPPWPSSRTSPYGTRRTGCC